MDNFQRNQEVVNSGGGSEQARAHDKRCICEVCNPEELTCPNCGEITKDGELCSECQASSDIGDRYGK